MKVLLVNPPSGCKLAGTLLPVGISYIASYVRQAGFAVDILDAAALGLDHQEALERIVRAKPDIVGISVATGVHQSAVRLGRMVKAALGDVRIILGGPHVHFMYGSLMRLHDWIDVCVRGEGERTMLELLEAFNRGTDISAIRGLVFRRNGEVVANPLRPFIENLDELPFPARDLLPMERYRWTGLYSLAPKEGTTLTVTAVRGCPFQCHFCSSSYLYNVQRRRSVGNVLDEIDHCLRRYDISFLIFPNDFLLLNKKWAIELCKGFVQRGFDSLRWACTARPGAVSPAVLDWLRKAGCGILMYGIEFGNQRLLDFSGKGTTLSQIERTIAETRARGILTLGFFMIGYPTETRETIEDTIRLARRLKVDFAVFNMPKALPGSPLYDYCKENGILFGEDDEYYQDVSVQQIMLENVRPEELKRLYRKALKRTRYSFGNRVKKVVRQVLLH